MIITLSGARGVGKYTTSEALKKYFGYRGTACYCHDFWGVIKQIHDAVMIVARPLDLDNEFFIYHGRDQALMDYFYNWHHWIWGGVARKEVAKITARWEELRVHYIAIVVGAATPGDLASFKDAFRVQLVASEQTLKDRRAPITGEADHIINCGFNDCAVSDIFDLVVDTNGKTPDDVAAYIGTAFQDKIDSAFKRSTEHTDPIPSVEQGSNGSSA